MMHGQKKHQLIYGYILDWYLRFSGEASQLCFQ